MRYSEYDISTQRFACLPNISVVVMTVVISGFRTGNMRWRLMTVSAGAYSKRETCFEGNRCAESGCWRSASNRDTDEVR